MGVGAGERGGRMLLATLGAFAAFSLMTIAVGTDYWLYARGLCHSKDNGDNDTGKKMQEVLTHSGLWRKCCLEGELKGACKKIDYFPDDQDYEKGSAEYLLRVVRASSAFPILSATLLLFGGVSVAASELYKRKHNILLGAGIFCVSAGLSNIIGIIVYISSNSYDPAQSDSKKSSYQYGWSFYFGALSFVLAEVVGVVAVHVYIDKTRVARARARPHQLQHLKRPVPAPGPYSTYRARYRRRSRSSSRSSDPARSRDASPGLLPPQSLQHQQQQHQQQQLLPLGAPRLTQVGPPMPMAVTDIIPMYALQATPGRDVSSASAYNSVRGPPGPFLQPHAFSSKDDFDDSTLPLANRRTTPV